MTVRYDVRTTWPGVYYPRPGDACSASAALLTDAASMFCAARWRYISGVWTAPAMALRATATDFGSGSPGRALVRVPPWTKYIGWMVLARESGSVYVRREAVDGSADVGSYALATFSLPGDYDRLVRAYVVDSAEPASQQGGAIHTNSYTGAWHVIDVSWYLAAGTEIAWLGLECLSPSFSGDGLGS